MKTTRKIGFSLELPNNFEPESGFAMNSPIPLEGWIDMAPVTKTGSVMGETAGKVVCTTCIPSLGSYMNDDINAAVTINRRFFMASP